MRLHRILILVFAFLIQVPTAEYALAATCVWTNASGDGQWSTTKNWSCDNGPLAGDSVRFDGTSKADCRITGDVTAGSITTYGAYSGTVIFEGSADQRFNVTGKAALNAVAVNKSGGTLILNSDIYNRRNFTYSSGDIDWGAHRLIQIYTGTITGTFSLPNLVIDANAVVTFDGTITVTNLFSVPRVYRFEDGKIVLTGDIDGSNGLPGGDTEFVVSGAGDQTISGESAIGFTNLVIDKPSGTLNVANDVMMRSNFTYKRGEIDWGESTLIQKYTGTLAGTFSIPRLKIDANAVVTFKDTVTVTDLFSAIRVYRFEKGKIILTGDIEGQNGLPGGSTVFEISGTKDQTIFGKAPIGFTSVTVNKSSGTLFVNNDILMRSNFTYLQGDINWGDKKLVQKYTGTIAGTFSLPKLEIDANAVVTFADTVTVTDLFSVKRVYRFEKGKVVLLGDIAGQNGLPGGSTVFEIAGGGDQIISGDKPIGFTNVVLNKSGGRLIVNNDVLMRSNFTYLQGEMVWGDHKYIQKYTGTISGTFTLPNFEVDANAVITFTDTLTVSKLFSAKRVYRYEKGKIVLLGDVRGHNGLPGGSTVFEFAGKKDQTVTGDKPIGFTNIILNKPGGKLLIDNDVLLRSNFTYLQGEMVWGDNKLIQKYTGTVSGAFSIPNYEVDANAVITFADTLTVTNLFSVKRVYRFEKGRIVLTGDIDGQNGLPGGTTVFEIAGSGDQRLSGSKPIGLTNLVINKSGGTLKVDNDILLRSNLKYVKGAIDWGSSTLYQKYTGTISGNPSIPRLTLDANAVLTIDGNVSVTDLLLIKRIYRIEKGTISVAGNLAAEVGSYSGSGIVQFTGSADQTVSSSKTAYFNTLVINKKGGTVSLLAPLSARNTISINSGTLDLNGQSLEAKKGFSVNSGGILALSGTENYSKPKLNAGSALMFKASANMTLPAGITSYPNLIVAKRGRTKTLPTVSLPNSDIAVLETLTISDAVLAFNKDKNLTVADSLRTGTAILIGASGALINQGTGDLYLGGAVNNNGRIAFDSPGDTDAIVIDSNADGQRRNWLGSGVFSFSDVAVQDQQVSGPSPAFIATASSTDNGNNVNWRINTPPEVNTINAPAFDEDTESTITLSYSDVENDPASSCVVSSLKNVAVVKQCSCAGGVCTVGVKGPNNYFGPASFAFKVTAEEQESNIGRAILGIKAVDDAPVVSDFTAPPFLEDEQSVIPLAYTDVEKGQASSCTISSTSKVRVSSPCSCSGGSCKVGITGDEDYNGSAEFNYFVTVDGQKSNSAKAALTIKSVVDYYTVSGTAREDGEPIDAAAVVLKTGGTSKTASTDAAGKFSFPNIAEQSAYTLDIAKSGFSFQPARTGGTLTKDSVHSFKGVSARYTLIGTVVSASDEPISGVNVSDPLLGTAVTNASGVFKYSNIKHSSEYRITAKKSGYVFTPETASGVVAGNVQVAIKARDLLGDTVTLSGRIIQNDKPIVGARLCAQQADRKRSSSIYATKRDLCTYSQANGRFELIDVPKGPHEVAAEKEGVILAAKDIEISEAALGTGDGAAGGVRLRRGGLDGGGDEMTVSVSEMEVLDTSVENPVFTFWNSFHQMTNILELINESSKELTAEVRVISRAGEQDQKIVAAQQVVVRGNQQVDINLAAMSGLDPMSYGLVQIRFSHNYFSGRMTYYKPSELDPSQYDYSFTVPFLSPVTGRSYTMFNTFRAARDAELGAPPVENWLSVGNVSDEKQKYDVVFYGAGGEELQTTMLEMEPLGRVDIDAGHGRFGHQQVGLIEISPQNEAAPYIAGLSRYAKQPDSQLGIDSYSFGFTAPVRRGNGAVQVLPVDNLPGAVSFIELANVLAESAVVDVVLHSHRGEKLFKQAYALPAHGQVHVNVAEALPANSYGVLKILPQNNASVISSGIVYYINGHDGTVDSAQCSRSKEAFGIEHHGSFNLFLGMANWLRIINPVDGANTIVITLNPNTDGELKKQITIAANGRLDLDLHNLMEYGLEEDTYGVLAISASNPGFLISEVLRVKAAHAGEIDFASNSSVQ